jgi:hypothetical protein
MSSLTFRAITLISSDQDEYNGWGAFDSLFWSPLITAEMRVSPQSTFSTFGQFAHLLFPKVQFVVCLAVAPIKTGQPRTTNASAYVSDQNLIEHHDTETFRRVIFDTVLWEARRGKDVPQSFADAAIMAHPLLLETSGSVPRGMCRLLRKVRVALAALDIHSSAAIIVGDSVPIRNLMTIPLAAVDVDVHLLTKSGPIEHKIRNRGFDLMGMMTTLVAEDRGHCISDHLLKVILGRDLSFNTLPNNTSFFDHCEQWLIDVSSVPRGSPSFVTC